MLTVGIDLSASNALESRGSSARADWNSRRASRLRRAAIICATDSEVGAGSTRVVPHVGLEKSDARGNAARLEALITYEFDARFGVYVGRLRIAAKREVPGESIAWYTSSLVDCAEHAPERSPVSRRRRKHR